jgi:hypothetical protein
VRAGAAGGASEQGSAGGAPPHLGTPPAARAPPPPPPRPPPLQFPQLPLVGKLGDAKPLPTYKVRVSDSGDVEVEI